MGSERYGVLLVVSLLLNVDLIKFLKFALLSMNCKVNKSDQVCTVP